MLFELAGDQQHIGAHELRLTYSHSGVFSMNRSLIATTLGTIALASVASARPELNAFINRPANTIPELITQLRTDGVVMDRFMRHFSMTRSEVLAYVGSLRLGVIPKSAFYNVYSVPEDGRIKVHKSFFKAGTPAFVNAQGQPILRIKCGNPFVMGPSRIAHDYTPTPEESRSILVESTPAPPGFEGPKPPPGYEIPISNAPTPTLDADLPFETPNQPIGTAVAALVGLGAAFSFAGSGRNDKPPTPVPEPATILVVGAGVAAVARRRKK